MRPSAAVLLLVAGALASACGGGSTATHSGPLDAPDCSTAVTLTTAGSGSSAVTVAETTDGQWFCVSGDPIGLDTSPGSVSTPTLTDAGSLPNGGVFYLYVLASDTPTGVTLRDETGADVAVAQARDGDHLLVLDLDADAQMMGRNEVERRWQLVGTDGAVLLTLTARGPAAGSAPATFDDVLACLADQGIAPTDQQPFSPEVARAAWSACSELDRRAMEASGMPSDRIESMSAFVSCMADQGWLQAILHGSSIDVAAHNAASARCEGP